MDDMQESEANHFHPFSLSITPFTLKMPTKHTTKLVELHLDDIRRVVLLNISLFPIAMSACGLRKTATKSYEKVLQRPFTAMGSACFQLDSLLQRLQLIPSNNYSSTSRFSAVSPKTSCFSCSFIAPPYFFRCFPPAVTVVLQGAGLHVIRVELLHDGFQRRHPGFHQVAVGQEHPATTALRCFDEFHGLRERNGKEQG
jgi:hypothetical protein